MTRIEKERKVLTTMFRLYCRKKHHTTTPPELCPECDELLAFALSRLSRCPHGQGKPSCRRCAIHCYPPSRREPIASIMRYSGPRMIFYHPLTAIRHLLNL